MSVDCLSTLISKVQVYTVIVIVQSLIDGGEQNESQETTQTYGTVTLGTMTHQLWGTRSS